MIDQLQQLWRAHPVKFLTESTIGLIIFICYSLCAPLIADELTVDPPLIWDAVCNDCRPVATPPLVSDNDVIVDLIDPIYENGVLMTENGGVLTAPDLRIQAQKITYIRKINEESPIFTIYCEGNLLIDYQNWVLVGDSLYYDLHTHKGFLTNGRTASPPWYIGGREILLLEEGELVVLDGFITTSEGEIEDVVIQSPRICLSVDRMITATNVNLRVSNIPIFWIPHLKYDLNNIGRSPFAVKFGWGGFLGSYASLLYHFLSWKDLEATARIDAFFGKGVGCGIETAFDPAWRPTQFFTRNYFAHDIPLDDPHKRDRYRFQGTYYDRIYGITIDGMYDFVSDAQMAADYTTKDFDLRTAGRTEIELRRKESCWIANLFARIRVNDFQSINQELPTFQMHVHPFEIPATGIMFENTFRASYLDYVFSEDVINGRSFASSRIALHPFAYRPFFFGPVTMTPEAGFLGILYSNSPENGGAVGQAVGTFGVRLESALTKCMANWKHVIEPYINYNVITAPSVSNDHHFIFTIHDAWDRLNLLRFGFRNSFFVKAPCGPERPLWFDLWANAFLDTHTLHQAIPKAYFSVEWKPVPILFTSFDSAWNFPEQQLDFYNYRADWTLNENLAVGLEYRHRSRFDWRKADFYNFLLESVRTQNELLLSPLSDRRDTLLFRSFYRLNPNWAAKFDLRYGWNRLYQGEKQKTYLEYQIELARIIYQHWKLTFLFEKREAGNRLSFSLLLNPGPPPMRKACL